MSSHERPKAIIDLFNHIERGEEAVQLLKDIWLSKDSYSTKIQLTDEQNRNLQKFFDFDDSE